MHWTGLIALLNVVGGGLKDTLYVAVGFLRAARFKPNDTFRWANKALLSQTLLRSRYDKYTIRLSGTL